MYLIFKEKTLFFGVGVWKLYNFSYQMFMTSLGKKLR